MGARYLCADVGGTQIKAAVLEETGEPAGGIERFDACSGLPRDALLGHLAGCLAASAAGKGGVRGVRLAMPGPFDYDKGVCLIDGLGKYAALYGADLRAELGARLRGALGAAAEDIRFINDVAAFALGELRFGCARGTERAVFICIGTGCGSAFSVGGALAPEGAPGVPEGGYIYPLPLRGRRVDDWLSRRGLCELSRLRLGEELDGLALSRRARAGDAGALAAWGDFAALLAEALEPVLRSFRPQMCCLGGQVTASADLFISPLDSICGQLGIRLERTRETSLRAMQGALCAGRARRGTPAAGRQFS